jgi:hypothetical protein
MNRAMSHEAGHDVIGLHFRFDIAGIAVTNRGSERLEGHTRAVRTDAPFRCQFWRRVRASWAPTPNAGRISRVMT